MYIPEPAKIDLFKHFYQSAIGQRPDNVQEQGKTFLFNINRVEIEFGPFHTWKQLVGIPSFEAAVLFLFYWEEWDFHDRLVSIENGSRVRSCLFTDALLASASKDQQTNEVTLLVDTGSNCRFKLIGCEKRRTKDNPYSHEFDGLNNVHRYSPLLKSNR